MPELPDITVYIRALEERILEQTLIGIRIANPFVLRTVSPAPTDFNQGQIVGVRRLGKQIVMQVRKASQNTDLFTDLFIVVHLMIAGRFQWKEKGARLPGKVGLAAFDFDSGTLILTEAGTKRRAGLFLARGDEGLAAYDRGGLEVMHAGAAGFLGALRRENHTIKRALTDPSLFSGIGNAYSDEILHRAKLSPFKQTSQFTESDAASLLESIKEVMREWIDLLDVQRAGGFPEKVTAFRPEMAVHGRFDKPCPRCGAPIQRIVYADNESNYCVNCQTGGKLLADRGLSRLLKSDWPRTLEELEARRGRT